MQRSRETGQVRVGLHVWLLRLVWATLPVTTGGAVAHALESWSDAPRVTATVLLWLAWGIGAVAVLAPRPAGLTALRAVAPVFVVVALVVTIGGSAPTFEAWGAVAATVLAAVLVAGSQLALASATAVAYGDELRFPLRTPPALFLGPLWIVRALVVAGVVTGPLLVADGQVLAGVAAIGISVPIVLFGARALHGLSRRWLVLVPAGVVIVDPLTLADPVLIVRRQIRTLRASDLAVPTDASALDLRLGASLGTVAIDLDEPLDVVRSARGRHGGTTVRTDGLVVAVTRRSEVLAEAARRLHWSPPQ